mgnify:FL=1
MKYSLHVERLLMIKIFRLIHMMMLILIRKHSLVENTVILQQTHVNSVLMQYFYIIVFMIRMIQLKLHML